MYFAWHSSMINYACTLRALSNQKHIQTYEQRQAKNCTWISSTIEKASTYIYLQPLTKKYCKAMHWPIFTGKMRMDDKERRRARTNNGPNKKTLHESSTLWMRMWLEGCQQSSCKSISFCIQTRDPWLQRREFLKLMLYYGNSIHICPVRVFWRSKCIIETFGRCEKNPGSFPRSEKQIGWRIHVAILASVEKVAKAEEHHKLSFLVWKVFSNTHVLWYPVLPFSSLFVYYRLNLTPVVSKKKVTRE